MDNFSLPAVTLILCPTVTVSYLYDGNPPQATRVIVYTDCIRGRVIQSEYKSVSDNRRDSCYISALIGYPRNSNNDQKPIVI